MISLEFYIILDKNHLAIARRYLRKKTYLNNFHTSKEYILLSLVWVETNDVGNFSIAELFKHDEGNKSAIAQMRSPYFHGLLHPRPYDHDELSEERLNLSFPKKNIKKGCRRGGLQT